MALGLGLGVPARHLGRWMGQWMVCKKRVRQVQC